MTNICAKVLRQGLLRCLSIYNAKDGILNWLSAFINCLQGTKLTMNDLTVMELSNWPFCCCNQTFHAIAKFRMFKSPTTKTFLPYQTEGWHDQQTWTLHFNFLVLSMRNSIAPASSSLMKPLHTPLDLPNKQIFVGGTKAAKVWIIGTKTLCSNLMLGFRPSFISNRTWQPLIATTVATPSTCRRPQPRLGVTPAPECQTSKSIKMSTSESQWNLYLSHREEMEVVMSSE